MDCLQLLLLCSIRSEAFLMRPYQLFNKTQDQIHQNYSTIIEPMEKQQYADAKPKAQISCAVTAQLISAFVFTTLIVQFLFYLYPNFLALFCDCTGGFVSDLAGTSNCYFHAKAQKYFQLDCRMTNWHCSVNFSEDVKIIITRGPMVL